MNKVVMGQLGRLKPEKIEEYDMLHANPWPEVLQTIHDCNLRNYSIFRHEDLVLPALNISARTTMLIWQRWSFVPTPSSGGSTPNPVLLNSAFARTRNFTRI